jgi:hypothetical protein
MNVNSSDLSGDSLVLVGDHLWLFRVDVTNKYLHSHYFFILFFVCCISDIFDG